MKAFALGITAASLAVAAAQTPPSRSGAAPSEPPAASGNSNQAVATTSANSAMPAKGSNSFTESQAQSRLQKEGFSGVSALQKDHDGIWHGKAMKGGQQVSVWVDYKGNVGQQ